MGIAELRFWRATLCLLAVTSAHLLGAEPCTTFEVASIKQNTNGVGGGYPQLAPGERRFMATDQLIVELILFAYEVSPLQVSQIPSAFSETRYDIDATCGEPMRKEQLPHLLQALLAERFHLSVHREQKEQSVYALVPAKGGAKLHRTTRDGDQSSLRQSGHSFTFVNASMADLVGVLSQLTGRKVVDRSGLSGRYDFILSYAPDAGGTGSLPDSVYTSLREQLGLNLETQKAPVEFIVVDHIEQLIPN